MKGNTNAKKPDTLGKRVAFRISDTQKDHLGNKPSTKIRALIDADIEKELNNE